VRIDPLSSDDGPSITPAGWYPDPEQSQTTRYWDGTRWTDQRAPAPAEGGGAFGATRGEVVFAAGCAVAMVIGAIGPWVDVVIASRGGLDGDGVIVLVAAIVALAACFGALNRRSGLGGTAAIVLLAGLAGSGTAIYDIIDIENRGSANLFGRDVQIASVGWGLWLSAAASIGLAVGAIAIFNVKDQSR
jgi:hypothetical protein